MITPKDSRDSNWQGPLTKTELRKQDYYFGECLEAATCEDDIFAMTESPEWEEFIEQAEHDYPYLLQDGEFKILTILEKKKENL